MLSQSTPLQKLLENKDIPLYMQKESSLSQIKIQRIITDIPIEYLKDADLDEWKMNLMVVSEQYQLLILAVEH